MSKNLKAKSSFTLKNLLKTHLIGSMVKSKFSLAVCCSFCKYEEIKEKRNKLNNRNKLYKIGSKLNICALNMCFEHVLNDSWESWFQFIQYKLLLPNIHCVNFYNQSFLASQQFLSLYHRLMKTHCYQFMICQKMALENTTYIKTSSEPKTCLLKGILSQQATALEIICITWCH